MSDRRKPSKPVHEQLWVRILCGFLGILMALGSLFYVLSTFELRANEEKSVALEQEISVGIAYGNNLLPTYTVSAEDGFKISTSNQAKKTQSIDLNVKKFSIAINDNLYKSDRGYEADSDRITVVGGYHVQLSSYSFRIGTDGSGDNPVSIFPGGSSGGSVDDLGYTLDEVLAKNNDLNESGILDTWNLYSYPIYSGGKYYIRVGNFTTYEKATEFSEELSDKLSMVYEISQPNDGSVSLINDADNQVMFAFFLNEKERVTIQPNNSNSFYDHNLNEFYGHLDFSFNKGGFSIINHLMLEEYIKCILPVAIPSTSDAELLKLFSVILRTKVIYNSQFHKNHGIDVCTDKHCSEYFGRAFENSAVNDAVDSTASQIITFDGNVISPAYSMSSGATTASGKDVLGIDVPYLKAISNADKTVDEWICSMSPSQILDSLINAGYTEISSNISSVTIDSLGDSSEYVNSLTFIDVLGNKLTLQGSNAIHKALGFNIPSVAFSVGKAGDTIERTVYKNGEAVKENITLDGIYGEFVFVGHGEGNGLGISIQGAKDDVAAQMSYMQIISKYYFGVQIVEIS